MTSSLAASDEAYFSSFDASLPDLLQVANAATYVHEFLSRIVAAHDCAFQEYQQHFQLLVEFGADMTPQDGAIVERHVAALAKRLDGFQRTLSDSLTTCNVLVAEKLAKLGRMPPHLRELACGTRGKLLKVRALAAVMAATYGDWHLGHAALLRAVNATGERPTARDTSPGGADK